MIQDDFFFVTTKTDSDIAAKGDRSWTQFRLDLMDDAGGEPAGQAGQGGKSQGENGDQIPELV